MKIMLNRTGRFALLALVGGLIVLSLGLFSTSNVQAQGGGQPDQDIWQPAPGTTWQWQLSGPIDIRYEVNMFDVDLFDTPQAIIDQLHAEDRIVICYFSAGSYEDWRPDAAHFPRRVLGRSLEDWPGERWLDIRRLDVLGPLMMARLDLAMSKDCDGVEPDNVDGYQNQTGFALTPADQLVYNRWLAAAAHQRGLSIGLKNDLDQVVDLVEDYDWALNEQCFAYDECDLLQPFIQAGKAVFGVEYDGDPEVFCPQANALEFSWLVKTPQLGDEPPLACASFPASTALPPGRPCSPAPATCSRLPAYWMVEWTTPALPDESGPTMTQPTLGDRILSIIVGTLGNLVPSGVSSAVSGAVDFAYVRVMGLPFIVLGYRQSGKTTLLEWLRTDTAYLAGFDPDPTAAGGDAVGVFSAQVGGEAMRLKPRRDVGGEYAMWETDWTALFREARPRGIIFMLDHRHPYQHKDALNFVLQLIDEEPAARQNLKMLLILVNKADLWSADRSLDDLLDEYRNEMRRLKSQAERVGYRYEIAATSVLTGAGVSDAMATFFNAIRPKPKKLD